MRHDLPANDIDAAYAVQRLNVRRLEGQRRRALQRSDVAVTGVGAEKPSLGCRLPVTTTMPALNDVGMRPDGSKAMRLTVRD